MNWLSLPIVTLITALLNFIKWLVEFLRKGPKT